DRFEGIQGPERIRRDLGRALSSPCALLGRLGVNAMEFRLCTVDAVGRNVCLLASANRRRRSEAVGGRLPLDGPLVCRAVRDPLADFYWRILCRGQIWLCDGPRDRRG